MGVGAAVEVDRSLYTMQDAEGQRYASFFATLEPSAAGTVPRAAALAFLNKSALSEADVEALYTSVKSVGVLPDASVMNVTEFMLGMHLTVCLTKRGLAALPSPFPTYLFPSLSLPTGGNPNHADLISSMPSPDKPLVGMSDPSTRNSFHAVGSGGGIEATSVPLSVAEVTKLAGSASLVELAQKEVQNNQTIKTHLTHLNQSEAKTLQHLQATLDALATAVDQMGFPVPPAAHASLGVIDDLGNLLRTHVQSLKQEVQSLEISARMLSAADEASSRTNSREGGEMQEVATGRSVVIARVAILSSQLAALQNEAAQLQTKKDALARQLLEKTKSTVPPSVTASMLPSVPIKTVSALPLDSPPPSMSSSVGLAGSSSWGDFSTSPAAVAPLSPPQETVLSTAKSSPDALGFGAFEAPPPPATTTTQSNDFGWGAFQ